MRKTVIKCRKQRLPLKSCNLVICYLAPGDPRVFFPSSAITVRLSSPPASASEVKIHLSSNVLAENGHIIFFLARLPLVMKA